jgi:hypothetical protein
LENDSMDDVVPYPQRPCAHDWPAGHGVLHAPQLVASDVRSTHDGGPPGDDAQHTPGAPPLVTHSDPYDVHDFAMHTPPMQRSLAGHPPNAAQSPPPPATGRHVDVGANRSRACVHTPDAHATPHPPQFAPSRVGSMHAPPQQIAPAAAGR